MVALSEYDQMLVENPKEVSVCALLDFYPPTRIPTETYGRIENTVQFDGQSTIQCALSQYVHYIIFQ
jgi:hypothetical protein